VAEFDIGFLGGGQLARMSIQAAQRMGLRCLSLDPAAVTPASQIAPAIQGRLDDPERVAEVFRRCDRVTLENEFIPADAIRAALAIVGQPEEALCPTLTSLETIQDKYKQRIAFSRAGVGSPRALAIDDAAPDLPFPMVLKARFGGYDGRGTRYAHTLQDFASHSDLWSQGGWMAESFVPFTRELAVMVFVSDRQTGCFPTMETVQTNHVCDLVYPADVDASEIAIAAVEAVGGKGLYGVELFDLGEGEFVVNELAPRPHNTGHYTLDWGGVSQFEQHVRLVMGLPLAESAGQDTCMANLLGQPGAEDFRNGLRAAIEWDADVRIHWYGKLESRPGRKMGHLNVVGENCVSRAVQARERFYAAWRGA
jgi:5-(carboxyamino)imidazole ribonucleotide synthase